MVKIGIPSALFYYVYYPKWETFFKALDTDVITSGKTTKKLLDNGVREALADACLPVKVFFGHAMALRDKVDYLFVPRIVCTNKKTVYCPKFLGMPDMVRHGLPKMPPLIDVRVDTRSQRNAIWNAYKHTGSILGCKKTKIISAYTAARKVQSRFNRLVLSGYHPLHAMAALKGEDVAPVKEYPQQLTFALLGYPYNIYDPYISIQIIDKLNKMGVKVLTPDNINPRTLNKQKTSIKKGLFWTFSEQVMKAAKYYFRSGKIDGAIHLTAFGCGPDSLLNNFIEREAKKHPHIPFMTITMDEHSGEAGITTRLEAFVDMVQRKRRGVAFHAQ